MAQTIDLTTTTIAGSTSSGHEQGSGLPWDRSSPWFIMKKRVSYPDLIAAGYTPASDDIIYCFDLPDNVCITSAWMDVITVEATTVGSTISLGDSKAVAGLIIAQTCVATGIRGYVHDSTTGAAYLDGDTTAANGRWYTGMDSEVAANRIIYATVTTSAFKEMVCDFYIMGFYLK